MIKTWKDYNGQIQGDEEVGALNTLANMHYAQPIFHDIDENLNKIKDYLCNGDVCVVIPMKEKGPVIRPLLNSIAHLGRDNIVVINDRSDEVAVNEARKFPVGFFDKGEMHNLIDWDKLLPILNLKDVPVGKGMTVLSGYLALYTRNLIRDNKYRYLIQHDAELSLEVKFNNLEYLLWGLITSDEKELLKHVKIAKHGRNNEVPMAVRSALLELTKMPSSDELSEAFKKRAVDLFIKLSKYKWMLTGQFLVDFDIAMKRPFSTGYIEETLISTFLEDSFAGTKDFTLQVANPNPCIGGDNASCKEFTILQVVSNFLITLCNITKRVSDWDMEDISRINKEFMDESEVMALIPDNEGPVYYQKNKSEKIIPSVEMLVQNNLFDVDTAKQIISKKFKS